MLFLVWFVLIILSDSCLDIALCQLPIAPKFSIAAKSLRNAIYLKFDTNKMCQNTYKFDTNCTNKIRQELKINKINSGREHTLPEINYHCWFMG